MNNKYGNVCTTVVPFTKKTWNRPPTSPRWSLICLCCILHYSQTAQHFNFVRRSEGTVTEEKLRVLIISQIESGPSWSSQKRLKGSQSLAPLSVFIFSFARL